MTFDITDFNFGGNEESGFVSSTHLEALLEKCRREKNFSTGFEIAGELDRRRSLNRAQNEIFRVKNKMAGLMHT